VETSTNLANGLMYVEYENETLPQKFRKIERLIFSTKFACPESGFTIEEIEPRLFSFNSPYGACEECEGIGIKLNVDPNLVVPNEKKSIADGAIEPWSKSSTLYYAQTLASLAKHYKFPLNEKWNKLSKKIKDIILFGSDEDEIKFSYDDGYEKYSHKKTFEGVINNLERRFLETDSDWKREEIAQYQSDIKCERCNGYRLKEEALCVKIDKLHISEVTEKSILEANKWFKKLEINLEKRQLKIAEHILKEIKYIKERRMRLGGNLPERTSYAKPIKKPSKNIFENMLKSSGSHEMSTTMALVRMLTNLLRDKNIAPRLVPIIPDEARTFGMEGFFQKIGIYAHEGQKYEPVDSEQLSFYREDKKGQVLEEGITEAGAMSSWIAAGTAYTNHDLEMIPIYIFYSMFGFQRVMDLAWAAGDAQTRGFLIGATSGRTTLAGEGLQHQDGHSHVLASTIPNCISYDPTFAYELAVILREGLKRMHDNQENIFYYITVTNENYKHPKIPEDSKKGILKGMYLYKEFNNKGKIKIQLLGCGTILREMLAAAEILSKDYDVDSDAWSVTSFNELRRDGMETERKNLLNPGEKPEKSYVQKCLGKREGPIIAASDYIRTYADQIRPYLSKPFYSLGTDGYGRSDSRKKLRKFFEVDKEHIVTYALSALAQEQLISSKHAEKAIKKYNIDKDKPIPTEL